MKLPFKIDLSERNCVVTGGAGVLCSTFSKALAQCGANVIILDVAAEKAAEVAKTIKENGGKAKAIKTDILDEKSLLNAKKEIIREYGIPDILINGAGGNHPKGTTTNEFFERKDLQKEEVKTFFDLEREGIEFVFNLNFLGTFLTTQIFAEDMTKKDDAVIINISSMNSFTPLTKIPAYSAAKAAISNFTEWLAVHFSRENLRVNALAPGFFLTEQNKELLLDEEGNYTERAEKIISQTPLERFGEKEELIGTLLWLVGNNSAGFVNGNVVPIDGGFSAYSGV
ncbi:SDR family oxidoreductase [Halarsenatibacter silvermanii]|uniref:NAD(P)-dependent dehydrogenase, short-chain alcohol dehydrogenase family n=1 Tax=Halarsenatibacter silvermanii TaxID=321763 RepID=A0A1G9TBY0_9FIRM|nr:SDR family oxidoreductase [Halarsenatibacter silvermanii]SDM45249.1 NAD(P)-dependent dehydrogenase, short-chain alcohol dehydrogenase family [Halarsenatibacter silvermanii]